MRRLYQRFFAALPVRFLDADEDLSTLTDEERYVLQQTEQAAYGYCIGIELAAYLLTYLPMYAWPALFAGARFEIGGPFLTAGAISLPWLRYLWTLSINFGELYVLLLMNLAAVHGIAVATGYIRRGRPIAHARSLVRIALDRRFAGQQILGIDPFQGLNHWLLYFYLLVNRFKGFLGNLLVRAALTQFFGNQLLRWVVDFSGMPVYILVNLISTRVILRDARVVVMGGAAIASALEGLPRLHLAPAEQALIYDTLQFIAINKRDYHLNHYLLSRDVLAYFGIPAERDHPLPPDFAQKLRRARPELAAICQQLITIGFVIDGRLSWLERRHLERLRRQGVFELDGRAVRAIQRDFLDGRGLGRLRARHSA